MSQPQSPSGASSHVVPRVPQRRRYTLFMLMLIFTFSTMDRHVMAVLVEPIKSDLGLSDSQMGAAGLSIAVSFVLLGLFVGVLADRMSRRNIIAIALFVSGLMTLLGGFALGVWALLMSRLAQGAIEAGTTAPPHSIIADLYSDNERSGAFGVYFLGSYLGVMIGYLVGAYIGQSLGWRATFIIVGLSGMVLATLVHFTLREPERGAAGGVEASGPMLIEWNQIWAAIVAGLKHLRSDPVSRNVIIGTLIVSFVGSGSAYWTAAFYIRVHGLSLFEIGSYVAFPMSFSGGLGLICGGFFANWASRKHVAGGLWVVALATLMAVPFYVLSFLEADADTALAIYLPAAFLGAFYLGPAFASIQSRAPIHMRTISAAIVLLGISLVGSGFGTQVVGLLSDVMSPTYGRESLRYALLLLSLISMWGGYHYYLAGKHLVSADAK